MCSIVRIEDKNTPRLEMTCGYLHNLRLILSGQTRTQNVAHYISHGSSVLLISAENCFANQKTNISNPHKKKKYYVSFSSVFITIKTY